MGKFHIILLVSVVTCAIISTVQSVPVSDSSVQSENADKCKKLCGFCGCSGYYCGEECLCECNSATDGEAQCVDTMKSNCKKLSLPFEVLIQGPNVNRMVRSLLYSNPDEETCAQTSEANKEKRSTISIYKPDEVQQKDEVLTAPKIDEQAASDIPIHVMVAQKLDTEIYPVKMESTPQDIQAQEMMKNVEHTRAYTESNQQDNLEIASQMDSVDRTNAKRHIIDVNQDISESADNHFDDSFIYKRDAEEEAVASPVPVVAPPTNPTPAPLLPKFRAAIDAIPTKEEIHSAWEAVRSDMNAKINAAIEIAQQKAVDLRAKINPTPVPAPPKFNPVAFRAAVPLLPNAPTWNKNNWNKNNWNNINNNWNPNWLSPWLVGQPQDDSVAAPQADDSLGAAAPETPAEEAKAE